MTTYIIIDSHGNQFGGTSTSETEIAKMAQAKADDRGESVYYTTSDESGEPVEVEPTAERCPKCGAETSADAQHGVARHADESGDGKVHDGGCDRCCSCTHGVADHGDLRQYDTSTIIRPATREERAASLLAEQEEPGGTGVIVVDGISCYVD